MTYTSGTRFHTTVIDSTTVCWISNYSDDAGIRAVIDPASTAPARRIMGDGTVVPLDDGSHGLTVYGRWDAERPTLERVRALTPEYAALMDALESGEGVSTPDDRGPLDLRGAAGYLDIEYQTARAKHSQGLLGEPDVMVGRSPRWWPDSLDRARAGWSGQGARTDLDAWVTVMQSGTGRDAPAVEPDEVAGGLAALWQSEEMSEFLGAHGADPDVEGYRDDRYILVCPADEVVGRFDGEIASHRVRLSQSDMTALRAALVEREERIAEEAQ